jgi:hypothetical protein
MFDSKCYLALRPDVRRLRRTGTAASFATRAVRALTLRAAAGDFDRPRDRDTAGDLDRDWDRDGDRFGVRVARLKRLVRVELMVRGRPSPLRVARYVVVVVVEVVAEVVSAADTVRWREGEVALVAVGA